MDKATKDYLLNKMRKLRFKSRRARINDTKKFTKKRDWKKFRANINKGDKNV